MALATIFTFVALGSSVAATHGTLCGPRARILGLLAERYQEVPVALGVNNTGALVELLSTENGSSWTIIYTIPSGRTCLITAGENWRATIPPVFPTGPGKET